MNNIKQTLIDETQNLKAAYIEQTKVYAANSYAHAQTIKARTVEQWCEIFNLIPEYRTYIGGTPNAGFPRGFYNTKNSSTYAKANNAARSVLSKTIEAYTAKRIAEAIAHYNASIDKLTARIESMGLVNIVVTNESLDVNFDIRITDETGRKVKAHTIIASGPIQCPHYRFLVKEVKKF